MYDFIFQIITNTIRENKLCKLKKCEIYHWLKSPGQIKMAETYLSKKIGELSRQSREIK